jgi:hypothetical protein
LLLIGAAPSAATAQEIARVEVTPAHVSVVAGDIAGFRATAFDGDGRAVADVPVTWLATPFDIAGADPEGTVTTFRPGRVYVIAFADGVPGIAVLEVAERGLSRLTIRAPENTSIVVGGTVRLQALGFTDIGDPLPFIDVRWRSADPGVAEVDRGGLVTGRAPGRTVVTAGADGVSAELEIEVRPNPVQSIRIVPTPETVRTGDVVPLRAELRDADGRAVSGATLDWSVGTAGAGVHDGDRFVAEEPGTYPVTVTVGSVAAISAVRVVARHDGRLLETVARVKLPENAQGGEIWPVGDVVYVTSIMSGGTVFVFDCKDPAAPILVDSLVVDGRIVNDVMTTPDGRIGVITREGASTRRNGLVFFDASDPRHPTVLSEFTETLSGGVHSAFVYGSHVFATDDATGSLRIIDFSDPLRPRQVSRWEIPREMITAQDVMGLLNIAPQRYLHDVFVKDGLAYLAYWRDGLVILDVGNGVKGGSVENPQLVSRLTYAHAELYPADFLAGTHAVFRHGDLVFLGDESYPGTADLTARAPFPTRGLLHVIDVSDIEHPRRVAWWDPIEFGVHNIWAEGDLLYVAAYDGGVRVLDISGELRGDLGRQGRLIAHLPTGAVDGFRANTGLAWSAIPHRGHVFISDINSGLWVARLVEP